jgi:hypothetical protein
MKPAIQYQDEIREFQPVEFEGLKFYPLQVKQLALYQIAKPAMELMLSTLPLRFVRCSWINALEAMDREAAEKKIKTGYFGSFIRLLDAALRTDVLHNPSSIIIAHNKDGTFAALLIQQEKNQKIALLEKHFTTVREILAEQNGYTIPDENWNPDLVRAQAYLRGQQTGSESGGSLEDAVFALAAATGHRASEIWNWPIREYLQMQSAVNRRLCFEIYKTAELIGNVKFTKGNPYPSWIWDSRSELPRGFKTLRELETEAAGLLPTPTN